IRHAESAYNELKKKKDADPDYRRFRELFERDRGNEETAALARVLQERHSLRCSDRETPITTRGERQARITGRRMRETEAEAPEIVFVSPYLRTLETLRLLKEEGPEMAGAREMREEAVRKKDEGVGRL